MDSGSPDSPLPEGQPTAKAARLFDGSSSLIRLTQAVGGWRASHKGRGGLVNNYAITAGDRRERTVTGTTTWMRVYPRQAAIFDFMSGMASAALALQVRFGSDLTRGYDLYVAPALLDVAGPRATIRATAGLTLLHVDHPRLGGVRLLLKDLFDRCVAAAVLILLFPLMVVLGVTIWLHDRGSALFTQTRVGKDGRVFRIYKFRTMVVDAEKRREELLPDNDHDGILFKLRRDPRVTAVGAHLRRWSIDELPQLLNVLLGEMSLVGPRPALPAEAAEYADHVRRRLVVKPGLTGLWQVSGRSDLSWEESVRLDLRYVENWSFALDLQIMWKTISALVRRSGAY
jgi:exopolysaccharide biosynthesis polyprenyl glycosylphosphotransferase